MISPARTVTLIWLQQSQVRAVIRITIGLEWPANRAMARRSNTCISISNSSAGRHLDGNWNRKREIQFARENPTLPVFNATSVRAISNIQDSRSKCFSCAVRRNSDLEHRISSYHACGIPLCSLQSLRRFANFSTECSTVSNWHTMAGGG